jgi:hypothetical protein
MILICFLREVCRKTRDEGWTTINEFPPLFLWFLEREDEKDFRDFRNLLKMMSKRGLKLPLSL